VGERGLERVPKGAANGTIQINGANQRVVVKLNTFNPAEPSLENLNGFVEGEGYVSIEPEHFTRKLDAGLNRWIRIPDYGPHFVGDAGDPAGGGSKRNSWYEFTQA